MGVSNLRRRPTPIRHTLTPPPATMSDHDALRDQRDDRRREQRHEHVRADQVDRHEERPEAEDEHDAEGDSPVVSDDEVKPEATEAAYEPHAQPPSAARTTRSSSRSWSSDRRSTRT